MKSLILLIMLAGASAMAQQSPHGPITVPCEACHSTEGWLFRSDATFDHGTTGFPLKGQHRVVACRSCHESLVFAKQSTDCASCHTDIHRQELGPNCLRCHTMQSWVIADIRQQHQQSRFPLIGKHAVADCDQCHARASTHRYAGTPLTCISCHKADFDATTAPSHVAAGFPVECVRCHKPEALTWGGGFDHDATGFPLTGAHRTAPCANCHMNNKFTALPTNCYSCHADNFAGTQAPNHVAGNFSHECQSCHTTTAWKPSTFDHATTAFPLTGMHGLIDCQSCHTNGNYQLRYTSCYQCHRPDYEQTTNPNHVAQNFSQACQTCHTTSGWQPASFDHATTAFPLTGRHGIIQCQSCHVNNNFQLRYTDCYQCHQPDYQGATLPDHAGGAFPHTCQSCHSTTAWQPSSFDHATTAFPLTGMHGLIDCQSCHTNGNYTTLRFTGCYQCHQPDFEGTTAPNHVLGVFPHTCQSCHTTSGWQPSLFNHATTAFPLTGMHGLIDCQSCHTNGNYTTLRYTDCYQCHQADFQGTTNPNHVAQNFSHACQSCHTTTAWLPASFDHATTAFPLTGAHVSTACLTCHTGGNYQLVYTDCYQCHQAAYQIPTDPNHVVANFDHRCQTCHTTTAWLPSTFNHDQQVFRIYSGRHFQQWSSCVDCHTNTANYAQFSCFNCHAQLTMNAAHSQVSGYSYSSPACYSCHRNV